MSSGPGIGCDFRGCEAVLRWEETSSTRMLGDGFIADRAVENCHTRSFSGRLPTKA